MGLVWVSWAVSYLDKPQRRAVLVHQNLNPCILRFELNQPFDKLSLWIKILICLFLCLCALHGLGGHHFRPTTLPKDLHDTINKCKLAVYFFQSQTSLMSLFHHLLLQYIYFWPNTLALHAILVTFRMPDNFLPLNISLFFLLSTSPTVYQPIYLPCQLSIT